MKQKLTVNLEDGRSFDVGKIEIIEKDGQHGIIIRLCRPTPDGDHMRFAQSDIAGIVYNVEEEVVA